MQRNMVTCWVKMLFPLSLEVFHLRKSETIIVAQCAYACNVTVHICVELSFARKHLKTIFFHHHSIFNLWLNYREADNRNKSFLNRFWFDCFVNDIALFTSEGGIINVFQDIRLHQALQMRTSKRGHCLCVWWSRLIPCCIVPRWRQEMATRGRVQLLVTL